ncbi:hypothetical protein KPL47_07935 [Clostridium estertheticum]|uniref:hypothetical protein n=1 Tax=Clostridium estertheticum TaxID=238834 RepID=UPI001C0B3FC4|nr:hypothetical protein [Clostridium estertheticum]MBU3176299.1 hypothetical protein [Clostridium estertheticum]
MNVIHLPINKYASSLYLWTERGESRHSKILDTDVSWDVYEQLENTFFKINEKTSFKKPDSYTIENSILRVIRLYQEEVF